MKKWMFGRWPPDSHLTIKQNENNVYNLEKRKRKKQESKRNRVIHLN